VRLCSSSSPLKRRCSIETRRDTPNRGSVPVAGQFARQEFVQQECDTTDYPIRKPSVSSKSLRQSGEGASGHCCSANEEIKQGFCSHKPEQRKREILGKSRR